MLFPFSFLLSRITQTQQYFHFNLFPLFVGRRSNYILHLTSSNQHLFYTLPPRPVLQGTSCWLERQIAGWLWCTPQIQTYRPATRAGSVRKEKIKKSKTNVDQMSAPINNVCYFLHLLCRETAKERMINSCLLSGLFMEGGDCPVSWSFISSFLFLWGWGRVGAVSHICRALSPFLQKSSQL